MVRALVIARGMDLKSLGLSPARSCASCRLSALFCLFDYSCQHNAVSGNASTG